MKRKRKVTLFILIMALVFTMSMPVFADDTAATGGGLSENHNAVTDEAITDQISTEEAVDEVTEPALTETPSPAAKTSQNMSKAKGDRSAMMVSIPDITVQGDNYIIEEVDSDTYSIIVTGGPITISGSTNESVAINIFPYGNTKITLDNINAPKVAIYCSDEGTNTVDLFIKGANSFGRLLIGDHEGYSSISNYNIIGSEGASVRSYYDGTLYDQFGGTILFGGNFDVQNITFTGQFYASGALENSAKFSNAIFKVDLILFESGYADFLNGLDKYFSFPDGKLSFIGCSGEMTYPYYSDNTDGTNASLAKDFYIKMNKNEKLAIKSYDGGLNILAAPSTTTTAMLLRNAPVLDETVILEPVNGYFQSTPLYGETYFTVFDSNGTISPDVVFSGLTDKDVPPDNDPVRDDVKPTEPKTGDVMEPWALVTLMILSLIVLLSIFARRKHAQ